MKSRVFGILFVLVAGIFPWLVLSPSTNLMANIYARLGIFCGLVVIGSLLFHLAWPRQDWGLAVMTSALGYGVIYKLASFLPDISTYPFSLDWSEGSRYYYASLWLSKQIYDISVPPSVLHPSRYLLQAIPFLIPNSPLWLSRAWQVFLWISTASLTSWLLVRRLSISGVKKPLVLTVGLFMWGFLFVFQGPVYYHLLVMVMLILWGYDGARFWRTLILVVVASLWAGISRVNWLPVPGLLAAALYLMETRQEAKSFWRYITFPALWVIIGTLAGYASQAAYQAWSGNPQAWFGSSFTSNLLKYRLLPNPTYPIGILPSALLVSLPLLVIIAMRILPRWRNYRFIRILGLAAILFILFVGGVIVSIKIGGGSNLHNLDAYLTLLLVVSSYFFFDQFKPDVSTLNEARTSPGVLFKVTEAIFIAGALIIPLYFALATGGQYPQRDFVAARNAITSMNTQIEIDTKPGDEVLFISQRQLLTYDYIKHVKLVPDNELVFLMEMAMSDNSDYLDAFQADISQQRYKMIISDELVIVFQDRMFSFGEENDAWVRNVAEPVLCYYYPSSIYDSLNVVIYTPRSTPCK